MTAAIQPRRMHAVVKPHGTIAHVYDNERDAEVGTLNHERVRPVMVISIAEYMRLKAAATRKGRAKR